LVYTYQGQRDNGVAIFWSSDSKRVLSVGGKEGKLVVNDPLQSKDAGTTWYWQESSGHCVFENGGYHVVDTSEPYIQHCELATTTQLVNYAVEFKMAILQGDVGGILFRSDFLPPTAPCYVLIFDTRGAYQLGYYDSSISPNPNRINAGQSADFRTGYGQTNTIGVVAQGSTLTWFVNGRQAGSFNDSRYNQGGIFLTSSMLKGNSGTAETAFSDLRVWALS
jgi:hypothetical protein